MMSGGGGNLNSVFYAESYHPIQAGSIDGTDIAPHDNAVYRAHLCSAAGLYDPFGDPKAIGDPYCSLFVGRLSHFTTEDTLFKAMSKYGRVKSLRLVRHIVTGASRGYAFVEFKSEKEMRRAYKDAHHSFIDDSEIIVDYNRQQLMPGWIPRRLGGGLGGKKESGQLRFGGRERPFQAPIRPIPHDELKRLGIPPPPEGRYMSRFQVPSPPRRKGTDLERDRRESSSLDREDSHRSSKESGRRKRSEDREERSHSHRRSSIDEESTYSNRSFEEDHKRRYNSMEKEEGYSRYETREDHTHRRSRDEDDRSDRRKSVDTRKDHDHHKGRKQSSYAKRESESRDVDVPRTYGRSSRDREEYSSHKHHHGHRSKRHRHEEEETGSYNY